MNKTPISDESMKIFSSITSASQCATVKHFLKGEEGEFFAETINRIADIWRAMPKSYETDGQGKAALTHLHYFTMSADWWLIEKDSDLDGEGQIQAFGIADLGMGSREYGYISLVEILDAGAELDFHYTRLTAGEIMKAVK